MFEADSYDWRFGLFDPISGVSDAPLALETLTGPYAFPQLAPKRFRGVNLVPRPTDTGNGPNNPVAMPAIFYDLLFDIGTNAATDVGWTHWLKPQIDAARAQGANCVRLIFDPSVRVGDASHHGPATWRGALTAPQFALAFTTIANYLASLNMYFYPAAAEPQCVDPLTAAMVNAYVTEFTALASSTSYHNVIGIDLIQEFGRSTYAMTTGVLKSLMTLAKAALVKKLPLTNSIYMAGSLAAALVTVTSNVPIAIASGVNFLDFHDYFETVALFLSLVTPNVNRLPIVIGESGIPYNGAANGNYFDPANNPAQEAVNPKSSALRARHYQDVIAAFGARFDVQLIHAWAIVKEWPTDDQDWGLYSDAQDGSFAFTTTRPEMTGPFQTVPTAVQAYNVVHTLDLTGADTTYAAWASQSTFMLGWGQWDYSNSFTRSSHRVRRPNGAIGVGLVDYYGLPSIAQSVSVDFDASQAVPSGGQIVWAVSLRHQGDTILNLAPTRYYAGFINYKPLDPTDGQLSIYRVDAGVYTLVASSIAITPFDISHAYRLAFSASGTYPTTLTLTLTDVTLATTYTALVGTDAGAKLQGFGVPGIPTQIGEVYYTNVQFVATNDAGPSLIYPTITGVTASTVALSWAPAGGIAPMSYVVQYVALDSSGQPTGDWTSLLARLTTTATVPSLTPYTTSYWFRVQAIDASADYATAA